MKGTIYVLVEDHEGEIRKGSLQALTVALDLASKSGVEVVPVFLGDGAHSLPPKFSQYGVTKTEASQEAHFHTYVPEVWVKAMVPLLEQHRPFLMLAGASSLSRDLMPRLAQRLGAGHLGDVTGYSLEADGTVHWVRPIYAGKATETVELLTETSFVTLRPNSFPLPKTDGSGNVTIHDFKSGPVDGVRSKLREVKVSEGLDKVELTEADVIVSGGIGVGGPEGYAPLKELCKVLNAALGASRAAVHAGWISPDHQVGQTGKTVSPSVYIACGISGMIQHQAGMRTSKVIVAINKDPEAPIFQIAHYGIVADLHQVIPALTEECRHSMAKA